MLTDFIRSEIIKFIKNMDSFVSQSEIELIFGEIETSAYQIDKKLREKEYQECLRQIKDSRISQLLLKHGLQCHGESQ